MRPRVDSDVRVYGIEEGATVLLVHQSKPARADVARPHVHQGEDIERYIERVEDYLVALRGVRDRLEAQK